MAKIRFYSEIESPAAKAYREGQEALDEQRAIQLEEVTARDEQIEFRRRLIRRYKKLVSQRIEKMAIQHNNKTQQANAQVARLSVELERTTERFEAYIARQQKEHSDHCLRMNKALKVYSICGTVVGIVAGYMGCYLG